MYIPVPLIYHVLILLLSNILLFHSMMHDFTWDCLRTHCNFLRLRHVFPSWKEGLL